VGEKVRLIAVCPSSCIIHDSWRASTEGHASCAQGEVGGGPSPGTCPRCALRRPR
jgi:hypothetical protein